MVGAAKSSPQSSVEDIGLGRGATESYVRRVLRLAILAPDIQQAIIEGRQPSGLTLEKLMRTDLPLGWTEQRKLLGT